MKKAITILLIFMFPTFALAAGQHSGGHHDDEKKPGAGHGSGQMHADSHASEAGRPGDPAKVSRTIGVSMSDDMRFTPAEVTVKKGETIRFFVKNAGKVPHEMVIGTMAELKAHAVQMRSMPTMQHADPNMITLKPGQRGGIVWQFDKAGTVDFACLIPGHLEAGMAGKVEVR
jgi:uncharacterized cupredoxin-like copper-binding protein